MQGGASTLSKHAADSPAELEKVLPEIFVNTELTRLQVAQIRAAWSTLGSQTSQPSSSSSPTLQIKVPGLSRSPLR